MPSEEVLWVRDMNWFSHLEQRDEADDYEKDDSGDGDGDESKTSTTQTNTSDANSNVDRGFV